MFERGSRSGLAVAAALVVGCGANEDVALQTFSSRSKLLEQDVGATPDSLPEPEERRVEEPVLSDAQLARKAEVDAFLAARYAEAGVRIVATTQNYSGDIVDWVDPDSVPGSMEPPPPPVEVERGALMEVEEFPELQGPRGTVPFYRPSYGRYVSGQSGYEGIEEFIAHPEMGQPAGQFRLYGGYGRQDNIFATSSVFNLWRSGTIEDGTFSILEVSVFCPTSGTGEIIGAVASRDRANFADDPVDPNDPSVGPSTPLLRLQVETYSLTAAGTGDYSEWAVAPFSSGRWVTATGATYGPGAAYASQQSINGGNQTSARYEWQLFNGNWWLNHEGNWIGYYVGSNLRFFGASGQGCQATWYGEVFDPTPTDWTTDDMGGGAFASSGWAQAGFIRRPFWCNNSALTSCPYPDTTGTNPPVTPAFAVGPVDNACYTTGSIANGGANWERYFYMGGPGGLAGTAGACD
jgi:hypothetical protein